jgi:hypothetical protein
MGGLQQLATVQQYNRATCKHDNAETNMSKAGVVVSIRLNPLDVMTAIDIADAAGVSHPGMAMSQVVKIAFEAAMQAARATGAVPTRDGFEYDAMVSRFKGVSQSRKRQVTAVMEAAQVARQIVDKAHTLGTIDFSKRQAQPHPDQDEFDALVIRKGRLLVRMQELDFKFANDAPNMSDEEGAERLRLHDEVRQIDDRLNTL